METITILCWNPTSRENPLEDLDGRKRGQSSSGKITDLNRRIQELEDELREIREKKKEIEESAAN